MSVPGRRRWSASAGSFGTVAALTGAGLTVVALAGTTSCRAGGPGASAAGGAGAVHAATVATPSARPAGSPSATAAVAPAGPGAVAAADDLTYGSLPSWLPTPTVGVGRVLTASAAHPVLAIEGDSVRVLVPGGPVVVTAVGPAVRGSGQVPVPATTRCTFTVTVTGADGASGAIWAGGAGVAALGAGSWTVVDERGRVGVPRVARATSGRLPPGGRGRPRAARTVTVDLVAELPAGSGALAWAPAGGPVVATWDFDVEID